jgi:hypothetical protein
MTKYTAYFRNAAEFAVFDIEAVTPEKALAIARTIVAENLDTLDFQYFDGALPVDEIAICDGDYTELAVWYDDDLRLRLAGKVLLAAARLVVARWDAGDLAEAVRQLSAAVAKAEGGAA